MTIPPMQRVLVTWGGASIFFSGLPNMPDWGAFTLGAITTMLVLRGQLGSQK